MKRIIAILLLLWAISFSACKKSDQIPIENGSINGIPALTLYGTTGNPADYIFILTNPVSTADKLLCYDGVTYPYRNNTSTESEISIIVSPAIIVKATLDSVNSSTVLTITTTPSIFASTQYTSR